MAAAATLNGQAETGKTRVIAATKSGVRTERWLQTSEEERMRRAACAQPARPDDLEGESNRKAEQENMKKAQKWRCRAGIEGQGKGSGEAGVTNRPRLHHPQLRPAALTRKGLNEGGESTQQTTERTILSARSGHECGGLN